MEQYAGLMSAGKQKEGLRYMAHVCNKMLEASYKKDQVVCLMLDDPDNLGAALVCHFLLTLTGAQSKTMK